MKSATTILAAILSTSMFANAQEIVSDDYTGSGTGFVLGSGVNSGINPPATRLGGSAAAGLRYIEIGAKADSLHSITDDKLRVDGDNNFGALTLSADGSTPFNFGSVLGTGSATSANPVTYDIAISMANNFGSGGRARFSFGIGTDQPVDGIGGAGAWDFGLQLYRNNNTGGGYTIGYRIDQASAEGLGADLNAEIIHNIGAGTFGSEVDFVIRVTDAGAESDSYNSRIQISRDGGATFFYNSDEDTSFTGFRFDTADRYLTWDIAGNNTLGGFVTYDNFSVTIVPEPPTSAMLALAGIGAFWYYRRRAA